MPCLWVPRNCEKIHYNVWCGYFGLLEYVHCCCVLVCYLTGSAEIKKTSAITTKCINYTDFTVWNHKNGMNAEQKSIRKELIK